MKRCFCVLMLVFLVLPFQASAEPNPLRKALVACIVQAVEENKPLEKGQDGPSAQVPCYDDGAKYLFDALETSGDEAGRFLDDGRKVIVRRFGENERAGASQCERKIAANGQGEDIYSCWIRLDVSKDAMAGW